MEENPRSEYLDMAFILGNLNNYLFLKHLFCTSLSDLCNSGFVDVAAKVPGGIYTDLMAAGHLGDPYYRFNDVEYRWVAWDNWTYYRNFTGTVSFFLLDRKKIIVISR